MLQSSSTFEVVATSVFCGAREAVVSGDASIVFAGSGLLCLGIDTKCEVSCNYLTRLTKLQIGDKGF